MDKANRDGRDGVPFELYEEYNQTPH